ncbi:MAG: hypothetical protein O9346_07340 [Leptospiraceae bacterium]|nr:hypothetical protein [Leptospiraceae bacterium]MCZ8346213.1 hypothetical protein [Leptospiraceae bacterium]
MKNLFTLFFLASLLTHCASANAGIATSNIPITDQQYTVIGPIEKSDYWFTFDIAVIGFPLTKPPMDQLVKACLQESGADALINIQYWNDKSIIFFVTLNRIGLRAEAIKFQNDPKKK